MTTSHVERMQHCYPEIYLACHKRHIRASSTVYRLSSRDSSILAHLDQRTPVTPSALASHLGVRGSTLSAALKRLEKLGYLRRERMLQDLRTMALALTPHGAKAMAETSVLDSERVAALLARLSRREKKRALEGLELLARAARQVMEKAASRRS